MPRVSSTIQAIPQPSLSLPPISRMFIALAMMIARWDARLRTRNALGKLDNHMLRDIGLCPMTQSAECGKPFWRD